MKLELKKLITAKEVMEGDYIPRWYGIAYRDFLMDRKVCYLVPINWFVRWGREIARILKVPRATKWEGILVAAYQKGYKKGHEEGRYDGMREVRDAIKAEFEKA